MASIILATWWQNVYIFLKITVKKIEQKEQLIDEHSDVVELKEEII